MSYRLFSRILNRKNASSRIASTSRRRKQENQLSPRLVGIESLEDRTLLSGLTAPMFTAPDPLSPTFDTTPEFLWTTVVGAENYDLLVYNVALGQEVINAPNLVSTAYTHGTPLAASYQYSAYVRATNSLPEIGPWSAAHYFDLDLPNAPTITSPLVSTVDTTPDITWDAAEGAATYDLLLYNVVTGQPIPSPDYSYSLKQTSLCVRLSCC